MRAWKSHNFLQTNLFVAIIQENIVSKAMWVLPALCGSSYSQWMLERDRAPDKQALSNTFFTQTATFLH